MTAGDVGAGPTDDTPYKSTFFKEYRVRIPAADHGNALVVIVLLYGIRKHRITTLPLVPETYAINGRPY